MQKQNVPAGTQRLASLDWIRGFVMILMVIDHASMAFNGNRFSADSAGMLIAGTIVPQEAFFLRWISHICAPTFVFLAGTALALSTERKIARGKRSWEIDRDMLIRGVFIALLDPTLISLGTGRLTFQVLYAIGTSMVLMVLLRRLPWWALLALGLGWICGGEAVTELVWDPRTGLSSLLAALTVGIYVAPDLKIVYPTIPWLAIMMVGWVFGLYLNAYKSGTFRGITPSQLLFTTGIICLLAFIGVEGANDYGNMFLYRQNNSLIQWLLVSKYPPSLGFVSLECGLLFLCLSVIMALEPYVKVRTKGPLLVFGQTAMFFYLFHRLVYESIATWFGYRGFGGLTETFIAAAIMLIVLYPLCLWFRAVKKARPMSWLRFI